MCAPICVLIDIVGRHEQQRTPLLRSIEGSAIALQSIRGLQTNRNTDSARSEVLAPTWLSGGGETARAHATGSNLGLQTCFGQKGLTHDIKLTCLGIQDFKPWQQPVFFFFT